MRGRIRLSREEVTAISDLLGQVRFEASPAVMARDAEDMAKTLARHMDPDALLIVSQVLLEAAVREDLPEQVRTDARTWANVLNDRVKAHINSRGRR